MPQERREKPPGTRTISAKVRKEVADMVLNAAVIRGWPLSRVVEEGAILRAQQIVDETSGAWAKVRKAIRVHKATKAGLARHRPKGT